MLRTLLQLLLLALQQKQPQLQVAGLCMQSTQ
jgi:hypothetical protein